MAAAASEAASLPWLDTVNRVAVVLIALPLYAQLLKLVMRWTPRGASDRRAPRLIAHRARLGDDLGGGDEDCTLRGMEQCKTVGVDMVELAVQLTADKQVVVLHDSTLEKQFPKLAVAEFAVQRLTRRQIPAAVPSLSAALAALGDLPVVLVLKHEGEGDGLVDAVAREVSAARPGWEGVTWGSLSSRAVNRQCRAAQPHAPTLFSSRERWTLVLCFLALVLPLVPVEAGRQFWVPADYGFSSFVGPMLRHLARRGVVVVAYTVNEGAVNLDREAREVLEAGATTLCTDRYGHFAKMRLAHGGATSPAEGGAAARKTD